MSDDHRGPSPLPVLRTRPATMLTALGLCVFVMIIQIVPEFRDSGFTRLAATPASPVAR